MFHHLKSNRKGGKRKEFDFNSIANFTEANDATDNEKKCKKPSRLHSNTTNRFYKESAKSGNEKINTLYPEEISHKRTKRSIIRKRHFIDQTTCMVEHLPTKAVKQNSPILNIPKKRFRNVEFDAFNSFEHLINRTNYEQEKMAKEKSTTIRNPRSTHTKTRKFDQANISTNSFKPSQSPVLDKEFNIIPTDIQTLDLMEPSTPTRMAGAETSLPIQDSSVPNSAPNPLNPVQVIDNIVMKPPSLCTKNSMANESRGTSVGKSTEYINKEQETGCIHGNPHNWASTFHMNSTNPIPSNLSTFCINQDVTRQKSLSTDYMFSQPFFPTVLRPVDGESQIYAPLDSVYTYIAPNPMAQLSQKVSEIQETLKTVIGNLHHIAQAQEQLQNTQNDIKMELQNLKMQSSAYENRENWLAENDIYLPMKCKEEFTKFCTLLDESLECRKIFEISIHFTINSKRSLTRNIASVIRKYFVCKLASQFTAVRYVEGKSVLANSSFYKHLLKNFLEKSADGVIFPGLTETDFNKALGEVLCNAKDCKKKKIATE